MRVLVGMAAWLLAEISVFVVVGSWIGVLGTLALVIGSAVVGVWVLRRRGIGQVRGLASLAHSGLIVVGAVLLLLPGFLTDIVGLALMVPVVRTGVMHLVAARVVVRNVAPQDDVLEGVAVEVPTEGPQLPSGWTKS